MSTSLGGTPIILPNTDKMHNVTIYNGNMSVLHRSIEPIRELTAQEMWKLMYAAVSKKIQQRHYIDTENWAIVCISSHLA